MLNSKRSKITATRYRRNLVIDGILMDGHNGNTQFREMVEEIELMIIITVGLTTIVLVLVIHKGLISGQVGSVLLDFAATRNPTR